MLLSMLFSCEQEVTLDIGEHEQKLVIYSQFAPNQPINVQVGRSFSVLDEIPAEYISNADVSLWIDDNLVEQLELRIPSDATERPYYTTPTFRAKPNEEYTIKASAGSLPATASSSSIPSAIYFDRFEIESINIQPNAGNWDYNFTVRFSINDPSEIQNFYHIILYQELYTIVPSPGDTIISDTLKILLPFDRSNDNNYMLAHQSEGLLLEDDPLNGNYYVSGSFTLDPDTQSLGPLRAELRTLSSDYYLFQSSSTRQYYSSKSIFSEPVFVYNNIQNGYGIFAGYNVVRDSIFLE